MPPSETFDRLWRGMLVRPTARRRTPGYVDEALNLTFQNGMPRERPALVPYSASYALGAAGDTCIGMPLHVTAAGERQFLPVVQHATLASHNRVHLATPYGTESALPLTSLPSTLQTRAVAAHAFGLSLSGSTPLTFLYDGVNPNLKWDGTTLTQMGMDAGPAPASAAVLATGGTMNDGVRQYRITLKSAVHESNAGAALVVTFAEGTATQRATIPGPEAGPVNDPQATIWALYGTVADGEDYFYVSEAPLGTAITVTLADDTLIESQPLDELVNAAPPGPFVALTEHRGQVFGVTAIDRNLLRASYVHPAYMVPEGWPAGWTVPVAQGDGDAITAVTSFYEWLIVWKERSVYIIGGTWPELDQPQPLEIVGGAQRAAAGISHQGCFVHVQGRLLYFARDGAYSLKREAVAGGANVKAERVSGAINDLWRALDVSRMGPIVYDVGHQTVLGFVAGRAA